MTEWLKNICSIPFSYSLNKVNMIAVTAITMIFNMYGKHLFKIDTDKIIKNNQCIDDKDFFYLYPLYFKEIEHNIGQNVIKIVEGNINDVIISVPWKAMLSEPSNITISNINITLLIVKKDISNESFFSENSNPYLTYNGNNICDDKQDLTNIYKEITEIISQYFNNINFNINQLTITILHHFQIIFFDINFNDNVLRIDKILIKMNDSIMLEIKQLLFQSITNMININEIIIDFTIIEHIPYYYATESHDNRGINNISINTLKINNVHKENNLTVNDILISFDLTAIIVKNIKYLSIENILYFHNIVDDRLVSDFQVKSDIRSNPASGDFFIIDLKTKNCVMKKNINFEIRNIDELSSWIKSFIHGINKLNTRFIMINEDSTDINELIVTNLVASIICNGDIFELFIKNIKIGKEIIILDAKIIHDDISGVFNNIIINDDIKFGELLLCSKKKSQEFELDSKIIKIVKKDHHLNIFFDKTVATNFKNIIDTVTFMIDKFSPKDKASTIDLSTIELSTTINLSSTSYSYKPYVVNIFVERSDVLFTYDEKKFGVHIHKGEFDITNKSATNLVIDLFMDKKLISKLDVSYFSTSKILINSLNLFLDPMIFHQIYPLLQIIIKDMINDSEPEIILEKAQNEMSKSVLFNNINDLKKTLNKEIGIIINKHNYLNCNMKLLIESFHNLHSFLIDDYGGELHDHNFELIIKTAQICLFDKSFNEINKKNAFICWIMNDIEFSIQNQNATTKLFLFKIKNGALIDVNCTDPEWKYFVKFSNSNMIIAEITLCGNLLRATVNIQTLSVNIREETLTKFIAFLSVLDNGISKKTDSIDVEYFNISAINILVNYCPLVTNNIGIKKNLLSLKNYQMRLSPQIITETTKTSELIKIIEEQWKKDINFENIIQFVPNIKLFKPIIMPIMQFVQFVSKYLKIFTT